MSAWLIWAAVGVVILAAGAGVAMVPALRAHASDREVAWSTAHGGGVRAARAAAELARTLSEKPRGLSSG